MHTGRPISSRSRRRPLLDAAVQTASGQRLAVRSAGASLRKLIRVGQRLVNFIEAIKRMPDDDGLRWSAARRTRRSAAGRRPRPTSTASRPVTAGLDEDEAFQRDCLHVLNGDDGTTANSVRRWRTASPGSPIMACTISSRRVALRPKLAGRSSAAGSLGGVGLANRPTPMTPPPPVAGRTLPCRSFHRGGRWCRESLRAGPSWQGGRSTGSCWLWHVSV